MIECVTSTKKAVFNLVREDGFPQDYRCWTTTQRLDQPQMAGNPFSSAVHNQYFVITYTHHPTPVLSITPFHVFHGYS